jgi:arylsulfatase A-like enzyme
VAPVSFTRMPSYRNGLILLAILSAACHRPERPAPRHVLLVVIDTQRADHLSCYGYARPTSPVIDALAKESVLFEHCVSQASWTLPSMVSMMTSSYVAEEALRIPDAKTTLAEAFHEHGYATGAFICNDLLSPENRFERGFDTFEWKLVPYGSNQPILDWIRAHKDGSTFTYVHLNEVHDDVKRPDGSNYGPDPVATKGRFRKQKGALTAERLKYYDGVSEKLHLVDKDASLAKIEAEIGGYDDDVEYSDRRIGEILDEYKKLGLWDSTAVAIAADHGEGLWTREQFPEGTRRSAMERGEPATLVNTLQMTHGSQAAIELVHVPFVLKAPGYTAARVRFWVENVDIGPTLLGLCHLDPPKTAQGKSLLRLLEDPHDGRAVKEAMFTYTRFQWSMIRQEGTQVLQPTARGECDFALGVEVYEFQHDSETRTNLASSRRETLDQLGKIADTRLKTGIRGVPATISPQLMTSLSSLGYIGNDIVDLVSGRLAATSTDDLVKEIRESHDCLVRLQMVRALEDRKLTDEQKAALRAILERETSLAVKQRLEPILSH